ncbi:hypothetical protein ACFW2T_25555 [Streptomyces sp. NPDC058892]|uniref:hypothetical protein n=1 Tax=unclassified Streptomyces TaxID=2593676 RepID=UPI00368AD1D8
MHRRTLPLLLVALLTTSGCVSVIPADDKPPAASTGTAPASAASAPPDRSRPAEGSLPLTTLPTPAAPTENASTPDRVQPTPRPREERHTAPKTEKRRSSAAQTQATRRTPAKSTRPRTGASAPKPRPKTRSVHTARPPAPPRYRPAPAPAPGRVDMADLCRASQGVTNPAITQLCRST